MQSQKEATVQGSCLRDTSQESTCGIVHYSTGTLLVRSRYTAWYASSTPYVHSKYTSGTLRVHLAVNSATVLYKQLRRVVHATGMGVWQNGMLLQGDGLT